jgi:fluoride exporter
MKMLFAIAAGGAVGAVGRYLASVGVHRLVGRGFPWGTLTVNVVGSLLIGLAFVWLTERSLAPPVWRAFLMIGLLGGFTTFSSFSLETLNLLQEGAAFRALGNVLLSVSLCLVACGVGIWAGRQL